MKFNFENLIAKTYPNTEKHNNIKTHLHEKYKIILDLFSDIEGNKTSIIWTDLLNNTYIAGGSIYSLYNNEKVNDYDIFCKSKAVTARLLNFKLQLSILVALKMW